MQESQKQIEQVLINLGLKELNEMQQAVLNAEAGRDLLLRAPTGSGKTLAFLLPLLQSLKPDIRETQAMIIVPSRELAQQIESVWRKMATGYKVTCCYGGHKRETEENSLIESPALIIGTAGRLADHIRRENITVATIKVLVIDEFDKSLDLGFEAEMEAIIKSLTGLEQRILTSATDAAEIPAFVGIEDPLKFNFEAPPQEEGYGLAIQVLHSREKDKLDTLFELICQLGARPTIIFCNHRETVKRTSDALYERGIQNEFYHGAMEQQERDAALCKFRNGSTYFLVTTDLAARGLDIPHIRYIIHYHLPLTEDAFTHRNGRTARVDRSGTAILIIGPEEKVPDYIPEEDLTTIHLNGTHSLPEQADWTTLFVAAGKKDKVNKVDIVGFLAQKGGLKKEDIGLIEVKDHFSFVAIRKSCTANTLQAVSQEKLKGKKIKIEIAR